MVLESCFYVGVFVYSLHESNFFGKKTVFSIDACCFFLQCVLAIIPMIGVMQVHSLHTLPGRLGQQLAPSYRPLSGGIGRLHALLGRLGQ